jgi:peptide/nickel transport system substrate-binding protein
MQFSWQRTTLSLGLAAAIALLGACGGADPADPEASDVPATSTSEPVSGGTLTHALEADPGCLDGAQQRYHVAFNILRQYTDSLVDLDPETGEIVPWLAESWDISDDAQEFTFSLKDGVTFSNGEKFDAEAVKANFDRVAALGAQAIGAGPVIQGYVGTTVVDPLTVTITFSQPNIQFLQGLSAAWLGIISPTDTQKSAEELCTGLYAGTGPFILESYTKNDSAVLTKRAGYAWPSASYDHSGDAYLDQLVFKFLSESGVRAGSLASGQVDSVSALQAQDEATVEASGAQLVVTQPPGMELVWIANQRSTFGSQPAVREAISLALNRAELTTLYGSGFEVGTSLIGPETMPYYVDESEWVVFDPAKAAQVLEAAGWVLGDDGIRVKDGERLSVGVLVALTEQQELLQEQLKAVGIEYLIRSLDTAAQTAVLADGDYDFYVWNMTRADPDVLRGIFGSWGEGKGQNASWAVPSEADGFLIAQAGDVDPVQRQADVKSAIDYLVSNYLAIPELTRSWVYGHLGKVHGFAVDGEAKLVFYDTWIAS